MLKEYANLSVLTLVALVALGLALSYIVLVMFGSSSHPNPRHQRTNDNIEGINKVPMDPTSSELGVLSSPLWDVFLSFYGMETRRNFISHLYHALDQAGIVTFKDDPALEKGEEISSALRQAIRNSKMFVVVISENFANSSWCLDELVEILSCKRTNNQVIPVFYYVHPSDLRYHKGSFGVALKKHEKRHSVDRIQKWKSALTEIAALSGYHLEDAKETCDAIIYYLYKLRITTVYTVLKLIGVKQIQFKIINRSEADTIQNIVENVLSQTSTKAVHLQRCLFGIDPAVEEIYQQLSLKSNDVRALGICGMGGIGKTTLAKALYDKYSLKFNISCFVENVRQNSQGASPPSLLHQLLKELLRVKDLKVRDSDSALRKLREILSTNKALIVFDDLDQSNYSELVVRICNLFSDGSRMIITTRDSNLLNQLKLEMSKVDTYMVKRLNEINSLELFSYHAFKKSKPPEKYLALSKSFVTYAGGLPVALKVLGSSLCGRKDVSFWKLKLEKVQKIPMESIQRILELSYDELEDDSQKAIFLDIVFFFLGEKIHDAVDVFRSCDFFSESGIPILLKDVY
ncbi:disease resistance protein RPV1-like [Daucus carota subsp. sativus]|uniref:disease resistance protein RPV1-like n=1 Tax=Daucus carota subsp. sativus TaxID=79200 RepID=UPI003083A76A